MGSPLVRAAALAGSAEALGRVAVVLLSIVSARTLGPEELGILGAAVILPLVVSMLGGYVDAAGLLVERERNDLRVAGNALILRLPFALIASSTLYVCAPVLGRLLVGLDAAPLFASLVRILALYPVVEACNTLPMVAAQRGLALSRVIRTQAVQVFAYTVLGLGALKAGLGAFGLAWAQVLAAGSAVLYGWTTIRPDARVALSYDQSTQRSLLRESVRQGTGGLPGFLSERVDNLLVVAVLGPASLAYYSLAWSGSRIGGQLMTRMTQSSILPAVARAIGTDPGRATQLVRDSLRSLFIVASLLGALVIGLAGPLVTLIFDERWWPTADCLKIMGFIVFLAPMLILGNIMLMVTRRFHLSGMTAFLVMALQFVGIPTAGRALGAVGAATVDVLALSAATFLVVHLAVKSGGPTIEDTIRMGLPWWFAGLGAAFLQRLVPNGPSPLVALAVSVPVVVISFFVLSSALGRFEELEAFGNRVRQASGL